MDKLIVETHQLKPKYYNRNRLWEKFFKRFCILYSNIIWKHNPLVHYPLTLDIELGTIKYHYFKFGVLYTLKRIRTYNHIMIKKIKQEKAVNLDIDVAEFHIREILTDKDDIKEQLTREMFEHMTN